MLARFCPEDGSKSPFFTLRSIDPSVNSLLIHPSSVSLDYRFHAFIDDAIHRNVRKVIALSETSHQSDQSVQSDQALLRQALRYGQWLRCG
jgi:hypothetical protein